MFSQALRSTTHRLVLAAVVLGLGVFFGARLTGLAWAAPGLSETKTDSPISTQAPEAVPPHRYFTCPKVDIREWDDTVGAILLGCIPSDGNIVFFAQSTTDSKRAARVLSMALQAQATGKSLIIGYDPGNVNTIGCSPDNCRNIENIAVIAGN